MKLLLLILVLNFSFNCTAQINLKYVFLDECDNKCHNYEYNAFNLSSSKLFQSKNGNLVLDTSGLYDINVLFQRNSQPVGFSIFKRISNQSLYIDTIKIPKLLGRLNALESSEMFFTYCDTIADGYYVDYYYNGKVRLKGTFRNGCPEYIEFYNIEGKLCRKEFYKDCIIDYTRNFKKQSQVENY